MHDLTQDIFERLAREAGHLCAISKRATLSAREVQVRWKLGAPPCLDAGMPASGDVQLRLLSRPQTATRLTLPGELGRHGVEEGKRAVIRDGSA